MTRRQRFDTDDVKYQTNLHLEPNGYWICYVNIDLSHQFGISVAESQTFLLAKRPLWRGARRNGCTRMLEDGPIPSARLLIVGGCLWYLVVDLDCGSLKCSARTDCTLLAYKQNDLQNTYPASNLTSRTK